MFALTLSMSAQNDPAGPTYVGTVDLIRTVPSLSSRSDLIPAEALTSVPNDGRSSRNKIIIGKDQQTLDDYFTRNRNPLSQKINGRAPLNVFDVNNSVGPPSDPSLAVGPNHVVMIFNTGFIIYDKDGNDITGPLSVTNIFSGGGCCDLTVSYDNAADRWVLTYLFVGNGIEIAVSDGPNPVTANWFVYDIPQVNDYNKLSVWSDGYYVTDNTSSSGQRIWALERDEMLAGSAAAQLLGFPLPGIVTSGFYSPQALNVTNSNLPAAGGATFVYLQDDAWAGVPAGNDHIKLWTLDVDWVTPGSSVMSAATELTTTPFIGVFDGGSFSNLAQPLGGTSIDALQATIMNQAQFRKFAGHNSAVFNFVIDTDAGGGELAGVRWYELRQDADNMPWSIFQEGTYTSPDGKHAWHASMAMDSNGNIGMGYTAMSGPSTPTTVRVSSYYTGRFAGDPINTMTIAEELIANGNGNVGGTRYGDYSKIDVDPVDDKTFWFINEYINSGGKNVVGVFKIAPDFNDDVGVVSIDTPNDGTLSNAETVTVTIFNYGIDAQSNIPINLTIDGTSIADEVFAGPLASSTSASYSFTATGDFSIEGNTYTVTATTNLVGDEDNSNDSTSRDITHLEANDVGVIAMTSPSTGTGLSGTETVTVEIENFGGATQTNIPVFYTLDGGTPVSETYPGPIATGETDLFSFVATADLSALGSYDFVVGTELAGDSDTSNDDLAVTINNTSCIPESNCAGFNDGVTMIQLADQDIATNCDGTSTGYSDDTDIIFNFVLDDNPFNGILQMGWADSVYAIWIDFNDNGVFEASELIEDGFVATPDVDFAFTVDFSTLTGVTNGSHLMRLRGEDEDGAGDVLNPCDDLQFGRTNDYTANISGVLGVEDQALIDSELTILNLGNDQFRVLLPTTTLDETLTVTVTNMLGQKLLSYNLENENGIGYEYDLDMSYAASGVYLIKVGTNRLGKVKRIIVE